MMTNVNLRLVRYDLYRTLREPFYLLLLVVPYILAALCDYGLPILNEKYAESFSLQHYYSLIIQICILVPSLYLGAISSLQFVEEREHGLGVALRVSPVSIGAVFMHRLMIFWLISVISTFSVQVIIDIDNTSLGRQFFISVAVSFQVPLMAFLITSMAKTRVQAIVVLKSSGLLFVSPVFMFFLDSPYHFLLAWSPSFASVMAYYNDFNTPGQHIFWFMIAVGIAVQTIWGIMLYESMSKKMQHD